MVCASVMAAVLGATATAPAEQGVDRAFLKEAAAAVRAARDRIRNMRIESELFFENYNRDYGQWWPNGQGLWATAWFDGPPDRWFRGAAGDRSAGRCRFDMYKQLLPWRPGEQILLYTSYSTGFDGRISRRVVHKEGGVASTRPAEADVPDSRTAELVSGVGDWLRKPQLRHVTGCDYSAFGMRVGPGGPPLADWLARLAGLTPEESSGIKIEMSRVRTREGPSVRVQVEQGDGRVTVWIDPGRGYSVMTFQGASKTPDYPTEPPDRWKIRESWSVKSLKEVSEGVWYPTEVEHTQRGSGMRAHFRARAMVVNDPQFDESVFAVPIPAGYRVSDRTGAGTGSAPASGPSP